MASRDLTNTFFERRQAANVRRRSSTDGKLTVGVPDRIKPFGKFQLLDLTSKFSFGILLLFFILDRITMCV